MAQSNEKWGADILRRGTYVSLADLRLFAAPWKNVVILGETNNVSIMFLDLLKEL